MATFLDLSDISKPSPAARRGLTVSTQAAAGWLKGTPYMVGCESNVGRLRSRMSNQPSPFAADEVPTEAPSAYVIEHFGFAPTQEAPAAELSRGSDALPATSPRPSGRSRHHRRRVLLAASVLGVLLSGGAGLAAAADNAAPDGRNGDHGHITVVDQNGHTAPGAFRS
jgi:hypothetical protein